MLRGCIASLLTLTVSLHGLQTRAAFADAATADRLATEADTAAKANDFKTAAAKYRAAYAADARVELLCNVGVAYFKAKTEAPRAHLFLNRCTELGMRLDPKFVDAVRDVLRAVDASLRAGDFTPVEILAKPPGAIVAVDSWSADESFVARPIWLPYGKHRLTFAAEGFASQTIDLDLSKKDVQKLEVTLAKQTETPPVIPPPNPGTVTPPGPSTTPTPPPRPTSPQESPSVFPAVAVSGATLAMIVASVWSRSIAHDTADDAGFAITQEAYAADKNRVDTYNLVMVTTGSLAVAGATVAAYLWYRALGSRSSTQVEVNARTDGASIGVVGRF